MNITLYLAEKSMEFWSKSHKLYTQKKIFRSHSVAGKMRSGNTRSH
jgi:hypothetical protein